MSYPTPSTLTGNGANTGMDPTGTYSSSPSAFNVQSQMTIEADVPKTYDCSDHFFVLSSSSSYRPWVWGSEASVVKVAWNCNNLYIYSPASSTSAVSTTLTTYKLTIYYTPTSIRATTDIGPIDISISETFWTGDIWLWIGADDDESRGSNYANVKVSYA